MSIGLSLVDQKYSFDSRAAPPQRVTIEVILEIHSNLKVLKACEAFQLLDVKAALTRQQEGI
jgi:hypothetical protein